jgi:hypothetical protein
MPKPPPGLKNSSRYFAANFWINGQHFFDRHLVGRDLGQLRADMHLQTAQPDVFQFAARA